MEKVQEVQDRVKQRIDAFVAEKGYKAEVAITTVSGFAQGGFFGAVFGGMMQNQPPPPPGVTAPPQPMAMAGGPLFVARNVAVMTGLNAGLTLLFKKLRNDTDDWQNHFGGALGAGFMYSLVANAFPPKVLPPGTIIPAGLAAILMDSLQTGAMFGIGSSLIYVVGKKFSGQDVLDGTPEDPFRATKEMLVALNLQKFEKNFKKGQLTDNTLTLLTEGALSEAKIPPGPRLLILNHVASIKAYQLKVYGKNGPPMAAMSLALPVPGMPL